MARIKTGKCYIAKLSKGEAPIRIESTHEDGGWVARTLLTSRITRIKTAEQIVRECTEEDLAECGIATNQRAKRNEPVAKVEPVNIVPTTDTEEAVTDNDDAASDPTSEEGDIYEVLRRKPKRRMSLLEAAYRVLTEYGDELSATDIVKAAIEKGYWQTEGKTPGNTLNAAIARDIKAKGEESLFAKGTRGCFTARAK